MLAQAGSRRADPRIELTSYVTLWSPDLARRLQGDLANISASGMFVRSREVIPEGRVVRFQLTLIPQGQLIRGEGEVVWSRQFGLGANLPAGLGIRFLQTDEASQRILKSILGDGQQEVTEVEYWEPFSGLTRSQRTSLQGYARCAIAKPERRLGGALRACFRWRHGSPA